MEIDEKEIDANIESLIPALVKDVERFIRLRGEKVVPTFLYVDRKDDVWDVCFCKGQDESLEFCMTRWTSGEDATQAYELCRTNNARAVAEEIVKGWDVEWDS